MSRLGGLLALSLMAGLAAGATGGSDATVAVGTDARWRRVCPKCGGKAMWHTTSAYCTRAKCGWFEVVKPAQRRNWQGPFIHRYVLTCECCGRSIMPRDLFYSDMVSGHLVRHVECHERAEADDPAA